MPLPGNFSTVPVHGKYLDLAGAALAGTVTFTATPDALTDPAALIIIMSKPLVMTLDVNGEFTTNLPATDDPDIDPIGFTYKVVEAFPGRDVAGREYYITVPVASLPGGIDLTTAAPAIPVDGVARGQFLNDLGDVDTTGAVTDSPLVRDSTGEWVAGPALSATYQPRGLAVFNVETYGAVPYTTQSAASAGTDSTSAIQSAINAAVAAGGGQILFPSVAFYKVAGSLLTPADGQYAQLTLPHIASSAAKVTLVFLGPGPAVIGSVNGATAATTGTAVVLSTLTGGTYNATYGWPSVIGAPDAEKSTLGSDLSYFSNVHVVWDGVIVRCPSNPSMAALNLRTIDTCEPRDYRADTTDAPFPSALPTHPTGIAILWPRNNNNAILRAGKMWATGYYGGIGPAEHLVADLIVTAYCKIAHPIVEGYYHAAVITNATTESNQHVLAGLDPSTGVIDIPGSAAKRPTVSFLTLDLEDASGTFAPVTHIKDASNNLRGWVRYTRIAAGVGQANGLTVTGATGVSTTDLLGSTASGDTSWTNATLADSWVDFDLTTYATAGYRKHSDGTVELRGLVKSGVAPGDGNTHYIFQLPAGYRPITQKIFPTVTGASTCGAVEIGGPGHGDGKVWTDASTNALISLDGIRFLAEL